MKKIKNLWKKLWIRLRKNCESAVNKSVDKWKIDQNAVSRLWNMAGFGGIKTIFSGIIVVIGGKDKQINKLFISEISTIST